MHKFDPANMERLMRPDRLGQVTPEEVLEHAGLRESMTFLDIGSGPGFFTFAASKVVGPGGRVIAIDTEPLMIEAVIEAADLKKRAGATEDTEGEALANISAELCTETSFPVDDSSIDFALCAFVLHEVEGRADFLKEVSRVLKVGALFVVMDWEKLHEEEGPPFEERISFSEAAELLTGAGYGVKERSKISVSHYCIKTVK